jgi:hypothetical protein
MDSDEYDSDLPEDESVGHGSEIASEIDELEANEEEEEEGFDEGESISQIVLNADYLKNLRLFNTFSQDDKSETDEDVMPSIAFILMDIDVVLDKHCGTMVSLFGRTSPSNQSIVVHLSGWYASICIEEPIDWNHALHEESLKSALKQALCLRIEDAYPHLLKTLHSLHCQVIVNIEQKNSTNVMGYHPSAKNKRFLKINIACASFIPLIREYLEGGYKDENGVDGKASGISFIIEDNELRISSEEKTPTYNSNFEPVLQFMVDKGISGCQWCSVPMNGLHPMSRKSECDIEIQKCCVDDLKLMNLEERSDAGSIRILSFDLEAAGRKGVFPDPSIDPVIQIGIQFQICGSVSEVLLFT